MIAPQKERNLIRKFGLDHKSFSVLTDVGKTGAFYRTYNSPVDNSTISYSPLYNDENPEKILALFDKFPEEDVSKKIQKIRQYQGMPLAKLTDPILIEAVKMGCISHAIS